ncbi:MAG TPA: hypothetical protein VN878_07175, partial [Usitatibacter sp.]|nr:hypothetical protein [Usitatibacter sp.]
NFTNRTLDMQLAVSIAGTGGGQWQLSASNVPIALNSFFGSTTDRLVVVNGTGASSRTNNNLSGSFEGSFVGTGLPGAILGYGISDMTAGNPASWNFVSGVAGFTSSARNGAASYREGRISDATGALSDFIATYSTTDRPDDVVSDLQGRVTAFSAPYSRLGSHVAYTIGTSQVVESGVDPTTGLVWGRWGGGVAQVSAGGQSDSIYLNHTSLHYIFAPTQSGPVTLPLTGAATYDVIGSTSPTDFSGNVGRLNSATLNANFTNRVVDASVNVAINGQTWTGAASSMPIYRDQSFSAYAGSPVAGLPNPNALSVGCTPGCGQGAGGSFDGFFTGRSGQSAGLMYRLGNNQGTVAFGRRGG